MKFAKILSAAGLIAAASMLGTTSAHAAKICFAFQDLETEFWVAGHKAITETLKAGGHEVLERNANEDANKQLEQVKDCIAQNVDGLGFLHDCRGAFAVLRNDDQAIHVLGNAILDLL